MDFQKIKLQEIEDDTSEAGRIPRTVEVELHEDLVDMCIPGMKLSKNCSLVVFHRPMHEDFEEFTTGSPAASGCPLSSVKMMSLVYVCGRVTSLERGRSRWRTHRHENLTRLAYTQACSLSSSGLIRRRLE